MKTKTIVFDNEIVKQGNSYCIRIPKNALEYLGLELGDTVQIKLSKPKKEKMPKDFLDIYKKTIKELKYFSYRELNDCFYDFYVEINASKSLKKKEKDRIKQAFEKTLELQRGKNFLDKYRIFKSSVTKKNSEKIVKKLTKSKYSELAKAIEMQTQ